MVRTNRKNKERAVCGILCLYLPQIIPHSSSIYDSHSSKDIKNPSWNHLVPNEKLHDL